MTREERAAGGCSPPSFGGASRRAVADARAAGGCSPASFGSASRRAAGGERADGGPSDDAPAPAVRLWRALALAGLALAAPASAAFDSPPEWTQPRAPLPLIGPITYVGTRGLGAYLIRTSAGAILVDATMEENVPAIERNIRALGLKLSDVKLILVSHAHFDHVGGLERMRRDTGARVLAGRGDVAALRAGMPPGETDYGVMRFTPVAQVNPVADGEQVSLGDVTLRAIATPGHTPGCTSWVMHVVDRGRPLEVVFAGSVTVAGNRLVGNRRYPTIARDYRTTFDRLDRLPADVVLPMHPESADVFGRARAGTLVAPRLLRTMVASARADFARAWRVSSRAGG